VEVISLNGQNILFVLKESVIHRHSKPEDPRTESNLHRFGLSTENSRAHKRQQEQSLSDYAQQDLSKATKISPLDMQRFEQD
jgi:hypothetical protein